MPYKNKEDQLACWRKHYKSNKEKYLVKNRRARKEKAEFVKQFKETSCCVLCEESTRECLDFHHLNPEEKDYPVSAIANRMWSEKRILEEISKCVILCANCHRKVHAGYIILESGVEVTRRSLTPESEVQSFSLQ